ncbi:MAG: hypothetical protein M9927_24985, partial [Anaerolineae bacterium]|nr:hypothetical protein [Anaerolineae bacterium]
DVLIEQGDSSPYALSARYLRGRGMEEGYFGAVDLDAAIDDYMVLAAQSDLFGSDGPLSLARALLLLDHDSNAEEIQKLCNLSIGMDGNVHAMMVLARLHELNGKKILAGEWYLAAYKKGLPWGMRYYARMHCSLGNAFRGAMAHVVASLTSPFLVLRNGVRSAFV